MTLLSPAGGSNRIWRAKHRRSPSGLKSDICSVVGQNSPRHEPADAGSAVHTEDPYVSYFILTSAVTPTRFAALDVLAIARRSTITPPCSLHGVNPTPRRPLNRTLSPLARRRSRALPSQLRRPRTSPLAGPNPGPARRSRRIQRQPREKRTLLLRRKSSRRRRIPLLARRSSARTRESSAMRRNPARSRRLAPD